MNASVRPGAGYLSWWEIQVHYVRVLVAGKSPTAGAEALADAERRLHEQRASRYYLSRRDAADLRDVSTALRTLRVVRDDAAEGFVFPRAARS